MIADINELKGDIGKILGFSPKEVLIMYESVRSSSIWTHIHTNIVPKSMTIFYLSPFIPFRVNPFRMNPSPFYGEGVGGEVSINSVIIMHALCVSRPQNLGHMTRIRATKVEKNQIFKQ